MASRRFDTTSGPSQRQLRVGEQIRRSLARILMQDELHDPDINRMSITVSEVRVSPDLRIATVYVLPLGGEGKRAAIEALARRQGRLRAMIGKAIRLRHSPELRFRIDETFERMEETRRLLAQEAVRRDVEAGSEDRDEE